MAEPTVAAAVTFTAITAAVPVLTAFGVPLGLRADVLLAGFTGAVCAISFLGAVPMSGDTIAALLSTSIRRFFFVLASSMAAGYMAPAIAENFSTTTLLVTALAVGAGAQKLLAVAIDQAVKKMGLPPGEQEGPKP